MDKIDKYRFGIISAFISFLQYYPEELHARVREEILPAVLRGEQRVDELSLISQDGKTRPVIENIFLLRDAKGRPLCLATVITDITERKEAEDERRRLEARVRECQKLKSLGVLAGGIAYDFNNLLTAILGNVNMALRRVSPTAPARLDIEEVRKASLRAAELASQMLAYAGKGGFVIKPIDLNEVMTEMGHLLKASISKEIALNFSLADSPTVVEADAAQVEQVVMNLITNASEAIGDASGVVTITTGVVAADRSYLAGTYLGGEGIPAGEYSFLEVSDTGCGMDKEVRSKLFDPFFSTKFAGRGLGMAAVLGIVRGHQGAIKVDSEVGKGTTFRVLLPRSEKSVEAAAG